MSDQPRMIPLGAIDPLGPLPAPSRPHTSPADAKAFQDALRSATGGVSFSKHALQRIERRELSLTATHLERLNSGADLAASKGSRSTAVLVDDLVFVVAVPAKTVVTAIDRSQMKEQIFTNIDSAVIA